MKTKHFLTALAIPALLAACSAEDDFTLNNSQNLAGRKIINADLTFDFNSDAATRLAIGETAITLDENDKVAAALIDKVGSNNPINGYEITTGISTNHPFTLNGTSWSTPTQLVEGNYLFYYQYNEKLGGNREVAVPYNINKVQNAFSGKDPQTFVGSQAVKDNAMGIGYAFLSADENGITPDKVKVNMYNLFAFLKFNIKTDKTGLEVQQILVKRGNSKKFTLEGTIDNSKVATRGSGTADGEGESGDNPLNAGVLTKADGSETYTSDYSTAGVVEGNDEYIILSLPDLAATATAQSAYMVIPAENYTSDADEGESSETSEFIVDVYTNQGVYTRYVELSKTGDDGTTDLSKMAMGTVQPIALNITGTLKAAEKYFVGNAEQWRKVLNSLPAVAANAPGAAKTLNIELLNEVELSAADIALIQSTNAKDYTINITGGKLALTESCALSDMTVGVVAVKAGVTVELNKNLKVTTLDNAGTININAVSGTGNKVAAITTLNNLGEATVNAAAEMTTVVNGSNAAKANNSAVKLNVKADLTVATFTNNAAEAAVNNATVIVDEAAVLKTTTGTNKGTIDNNGQIIAEGKFTNTGGKAVIKNKATGILSNVNGEGKAVENLDGGSIDAEAGSTTIVANNTGSTITYQDGANVSVTGSDEKKGKIAYVVTSAYLVPTAAVEYNTIVVDGLNLILKTTADQTEPAAEKAMLSTVGITNVVLKDGATVDFKLLKSDETITLIEIQGGNNKIVTAAGGISTTTLKVLAKGYVLIPLNSKVTSTGKADGVGLQNKGTINVGGTLVYEGAEAVEGQLLGTGTITKKTDI